MARALCFILQYCRIIFYVVDIFLTIKGKEVAMQDDADALEQAGIYALALEDVIHIGTVAVQLGGQPSHAALLSIELCFYFFTYVYGHLSCDHPTTG